MYFRKIGFASNPILLPSKAMFVLVIFVIFGFYSCKQASPFHGHKPTAMGSTNHVDFVLDTILSKGMIWDSIDYYFASSYPVMPAPEPFFDLRKLTMEEIMSDPYKKELKTMVFVVNLSDTNSLTTQMMKKDFGAEKWKRALTDSTFSMSIARDKWAKNQLLVYLFAKNEKKLASIMRTNFPLIAARINQHDGPSIAASLYGVKGKNIDLSEAVQKSFGLFMDIPPSYVKALEADNFLWIRMDDSKSVQNFVFRKFAYTDTAQFSKENIISLRDTYGKEFIKTSSDDAYMQTNVIDLPVYAYEMNSNGLYGREVRGIWETVNDFMGGPFFSYLLLNKEKNEVIFIDAFILAPGEDKRDLMQKMDYVVKNARF
ncbi:MAG: DUF4837 family protein [Saprospiraceae bacterium]